MKRKTDSNLIWESYLNEQVPPTAPGPAQAAPPQAPGTGAPAAMGAEAPEEAAPGPEEAAPGNEDFTAYRVLVGQPNVQKVARMMAAIQAGKVPSADLLNAYKPAFDLVDTIVKSGLPTIKKIYALLGKESPSPTGPSAGAAAPPAGPGTGY